MEAPRNVETGLDLNDEEWVAIGAKARYDVSENFGISFSVRGATSGNPVPMAPYVSIGLYHGD